MGGWSGIDISGRQSVRCCFRLLNGPLSANPGRVALCAEDPSPAGVVMVQSSLSKRAERIYIYIYIYAIHYDCIR